MVSGKFLFYCYGKDNHKNPFITRGLCAKVKADFIIIYKFIIIITTTL